jgi:hypothetical protein
LVYAVNPHVVPFLYKANVPSSIHRVAEGAFFLFKSEVQHRLQQLIDIDVFPTTLHRVQNILSQRYYGDITIIPDVKVVDYLQLVSSPSFDTLVDATVRGERATWPKMSIIKNHCQIELALDEIMYRVRCKRLEEKLNAGASSLEPSDDSKLLDAATPGATGHFVPPRRVKSSLKMTAMLAQNDPILSKSLTWNRNVKRPDFHLLMSQVTKSETDDEEVKLDVPVAENEQPNDTLLMKKLRNGKETKSNPDLHSSCS